MFGSKEKYLISLVTRLVKVFDTPPCIGVTVRNHASRYVMENMIYTMMMMIIMSTNGIPIAPLIFIPTWINQYSSHSSNPGYGL
jgi:hypothetical protein